LDQLTYTDNYKAYILRRIIHGLIPVLLCGWRGHYEKA